VKRSLIAATVYFLTVFIAGFVLGSFRVVYVAPRFGELAATLIEAPFMVGAAFFICRWVLRRWSVPPQSELRWIMAAWFLILLFVFEWKFGVWLFGRTGAQQLEMLARPAGLVGLSAQLAAALFPVFLIKPRPL